MNSVRVLTVIVTLALVIISALSWIVFGKIEKIYLRDDFFQKASIIMNGANAAQHYSSVEVKPLLESKVGSQFLPQSIPFYAASRIMEQQLRRAGDYEFKVAALNPTNPVAAASPWEADIIVEFAAKPYLVSLVSETESHFVYAEPVRVESAECLQCHSTPEVAPKGMLDIYGSKNGFGWKRGDTVGAKIVSAPKQTVHRVVGRKLNDTMFLGALVVLATALVIFFAVYVILLRPLQIFSRTADEISVGGEIEFQRSYVKELRSLSTSFTRMQRSHHAAISMLRAKKPQHSGPGMRSKPCGLRVDG